MGQYGPPSLIGLAMVGSQFWLWATVCGRAIAKWQERRRD